MSTSECSNLVARAKPHVPVRPALYSPPMTDSDLAAAWAAVHDATPDGWYIGRPYDDEHHDRLRPRLGLERLTRPYGIYSAVGSSGSGNGGSSPS